MRKRFNQILLVLAGGLLISGVWACQNQKTQGEKIGSMQLKNNSDLPYEGTVEIDYDLLNVPEVNSQVYIPGKTPRAVQPFDKNGDGKNDVWIFEVQIPSGKEVQEDFYAATDTSGLGLEKKTYAELSHKITGHFNENGEYVSAGNFYPSDSVRVPDGFSDHAYYFKYEGPGWESDKVGYRMYLDWRNANDVFGKKTNDIILPGVGLDGYESYHHMQDWGMDILKVGASLGVGSIAYWDGEKAVRVEKTDSVFCAIPDDGLVRSRIKTWYYGWDMNDKKTDMISEKSIDAGSRMTHEVLTFSDGVDNICTGLAKENNTELIEIESDGWQALATWGEQSLGGEGDLLGMAVVFPKSQSPLITEDAINHLVVFEEKSDRVEFYFLAAWEQEPQGIKTLDEFKSYLNQTLVQLDNMPVAKPL